MAITTYTELKTAIANWLARDDLTSVIPDFITLFEAHANRELRVRRMETTATLTPSSGVATLPTDYLEARRLTYQGADAERSLVYVSPDILHTMFPTAPTDIPAVYTIEGGSIITRPSDTTNLELAYYQKIGPLADDTEGSEGWLFAQHPDAYLFGALAEAQGYNIEVTKMATWIARRDGVLEAIKRLDMAGRPPMSIYVDGNTP